MKARLPSLATAALAILLAVAPPAAAAPTDVSQQDREYLNQAHQANLFEIITGNLVERGSCPRVRELGPQFAAHHTELDADLIAVAARTGVPLYSVPDPGQLTAIANVAARSGPDFDATWLRDQLAAHVQSIAQGEKETRYGWSPEVKELAARSEPVLRHHLDEVLAAASACIAG